MERGSHVDDLAKRLNLKAGMQVVLLNDHAGVEEPLRAVLGDGLRDAPAAGADGAADAVLFFAANSAELATLYTAAKPVLGPASMLWVMYPKKSSGVKSDLTRDVGWAPINADGWQSVRQISVDDTWSAVRYKQVADAEVRGDVGTHYGGAKAHLRPIFDRVVQAIEALGPEVREPLVRGNYVVWSRKSHFVAVGPVGKAGVGVAFKFRQRPFEGRFQSSSKVGGGGFTHLVTLTSLDEVDDEFLGYLRQAYEASV